MLGHFLNSFVYSFHQDIQPNPVGLCFECDRFQVPGVEQDMFLFQVLNNIFFISSALNNMSNPCRYHSRQRKLNFGFLLTKDREPVQFQVLIGEGNIIAVTTEQHALSPDSRVQRVVFIINSFIHSPPYYSTTTTLNYDSIKPFNAVTNPVPNPF